MNNFLMDNYIYIIDNYQEFQENSLSREQIIGKLEEMKDTYLELNSADHNNKICKIANIKESFFVVQYFDKLNNPTYHESFDFDAYRLRRIILNKIGEYIGEKKHKRYEFECFNENFVRVISDRVSLTEQLQRLAKKLPKDETDNLLVEIRESKCEIEKEKLITKLLLGHLYLLLATARKSKNTKYFNNGLIELDDLFQTGFISMMERTPRLLFNTDIPVYKKPAMQYMRWSFSTYSRLVMPIKVSEKTQSNFTEIMKAKNELITELIRFPSIEEVAAKIGKSVKHVGEFMGTYESHVSLDAKIEDDGDDEYYSLVPSPFGMSQEKIVNKIMLDEAIKTLSKRHQDFVYLRFYRDLPYAEVAERLNYSKGRGGGMTTACNNILEKLKNHIQGKHLIKIDEAEARHNLLKATLGEDSEVNQYIDELDNALEQLDGRQRLFITKRFFEGLNRSASLRAVGLTGANYETNTLETLKVKLLKIENRKSTYELIQSDLKMEAPEHILKGIIECFEGVEKEFIHKRYIECKKRDEICEEMKFSATAYARLRNKCLEKIHRNVEILKNEI